MRIFGIRTPVALAATAAALLLLLVGSCVERETPTAPEDVEAPERPEDTSSAAQPLGNGPLLVLKCDVSVANREMTCGEPDAEYPATAPGGPQRIIVGGQGTFVSLQAWDVNYDSNAQVFQMDVEVKNLIGQIFGSSDGTSVTNNGLQVFFSTEPTTTVGSGMITVSNHDGSQNFTASNQKFFQYKEFLRDDETSSRRTWRFDVPNTVERFTFEVFVNGDVQYPNGWVDVTPNQTGVANGSSVTLSAQARDEVGRAVSRTYSWASSNATNVSLSANSGSSVMATGNTSGASETITVTSSGTESDGTSTVTVDGADMAVTGLQVGPDPVGVGGTLQVFGELTNNGPNAVTDAHIEIKVSGASMGHEALAGSSGGASCSWTFGASDVTYDCDLGDLASGASNDITVHVEPEAAATLTVDAKVLSIGSGGTDNNAANDNLSRSVTATSGPNLEAGALTITPNPTTTSDNTITIDGSITNTGDQATASTFTWRIMVDGAEAASGTVAPPLGAGASIGSGTITASGVGPFSAGGHKAQLIVDTGNDVAEDSEDDNQSEAGLVTEGSGFDIQIKFLTEFPSGEQTTITDAINRWSSIITGDLTANTSVLESVNCGHPAVYGTDDLTIFVQEKDLGGVGGTLAQAGPCWRRSGSLLPISGTITIDSNDWDAMLADNTAQFVIAHEAGHVLGIGVNWDDLGLIVGEGGADPYMVGSSAADTEFDAANGDVCYTANDGVPLANTGGSGTRDSHWRENVMDTEMMTGYSEDGGSPPVEQEISRITGANLTDLGYTVNLGSSEIDQSYTVPCMDTAPGIRDEEQRVPFDEVLQPRYEITPDGEIIELPIGN